MPKEEPGASILYYDNEANSNFHLTVESLLANQNISHSQFKTKISTVRVLALKKSHPE
jgi:hypothetical protein